MEFGVRHNSLPDTNNVAHSEEMIQIAREIVVKHEKLDNSIKFDEDIDENYIRNLSFGAKSQVIPLCSFWGGIISMEIVKFTGKFIPLQEFYHFDSGIQQVNIDHSKKEGHWTRYDDQISVIGKEMTEKLQRMK
jgi:ubiquitin-activating enzyme E1